MFQRVQLLSSSNKVLSPAAVDAAALAGYSPSDFPNPESSENGQKLTEDDKKFIESKLLLSYSNIRENIC